MEISLYFPEILLAAFILVKTSCRVLLSIAIVCPRCLWLITVSVSVLSVCMLSVVSIFVINLVVPICILRPVFRLSSFTVFN